MAQLGSKIKVETSTIPDFVREELAAITFACARDFFSSPDNRDSIEVKDSANELKTSKK